MTAPDVYSDTDDKFSGKLVLVLLDNKTSPSIKGGRSLWGLQRPISYRSKVDEVITVPAGFVTDLASVPRWGWIIIPPDGPWVKAAIVHDYLYATAGTGRWKGHNASVTRSEAYTRAEADGIFRDAMANRGVGPIARFILYTAVRIGGGPGWGIGGAKRWATEVDERFVIGG